MVSLPNCRVLPTLNCRISNSNLTSNLKFELQALAAPAALFYLGKLCSAPLPLRSHSLKKLSAPIPLRSFRLPKFSAPLPLLHAFGGLRSAPAFFRSKSLIYAPKMSGSGEVTSLVETRRSPCPKISDYSHSECA